MGGWNWNLIPGSETLRYLGALGDQIFPDSHLNIPGTGFGRRLNYHFHSNNIYGNNII